MDDIDTAGAATGQAPGTTQPPAGTASAPPAGGAPSGQVPGAQDGGTDAEIALRKQLDEARKDAAKYRTENKRLTDAQQAAADAELSELEKANKRAAELEKSLAEVTAKADERALRLATVEAATRLNFRNPSLAFNLIDRASLEFNTDGSPKNVDDLLGKILTADPYLGTGTGDFGGGNRGNTPPTTNTMTDALRALARGG